MSDSQRILDSIRRLVRMLRVSDRQAQAELGVSGAQLFVLTELGKTPAMSLNDLAARTLTDQSSVSVVVTRLVEAGLVSRDRDANDARRLVLHLTRAGRAMLQNAPPVVQERLLAVFDALSDDERKRFADTFQEIVDSVAGDDGAAPMLFEDDAEGRRQHHLKAVPKKNAAS
ncbi:MAG TPA: MarR family transcriptional regulator [Thermoanaerobaculia bacterium]|jgi:DNA-binding MarR family transcriptional regulator|nr:MarR family transcriptional regulator [Thermoanaerobaculia bacterium]